jgi:hypothetical protein
VGLAIVVLLIGLPIGLYMLLRPKKMWWTFEAWKYEKPEANEPSEAGYGMSALRGAGVIVATIILAALAWTKPDPADKTQAAPWTPPSYAYTSPPPLPKPQERGELPIVGYRIDDGYVDIYYLSPAGAQATNGGMNTEPRDGCQMIQTVTGLGTERVTIDLQLFWSNRFGYLDKATDEKCQVTGTWSPNSLIAPIRVANVSPGTTILTNGAVAEPNGKVLKPAAPGNVVPERKG